MMARLTKEQAKWKHSIEWLTSFAEREGMAIELRNPSHPEYQIARLTCDGVRLVAYPHTVSSTLNQHCRVRNENSNDKEKAAAIMARLDWRNNWVDGKGFIGMKIKAAGYPK